MEGFAGATGFGRAIPCVVVETTEGFAGVTGFGRAIPCVVVETTEGFGGTEGAGFGDGVIGIVAVETVLGGCCPMGMVAVETDPSAFGEGARGLSLIVFLAAEEAMTGVAAGTRFSVPVSVLRSFSGSFSPPLSLLGVFSLMFSILFSQQFLSAWKSGKPQCHPSEGI